MTKLSIIALIPVKGNSERVIKKNIRPFADTNLLELKLNQIIESKSVDKIIVSSESSEVLDYANKFNNVITHKRDSSYSTSSVPMSSVYSHLAKEVECENIMWAQVTNPLAGSKIYQKAVDLYFSMDSKFDCLLSCSEVKDYLLRDFKPLNFTRIPWMKSQDLEGIHELTFVANILKRDNLIKWGSLVGENPYYIELDKDISMDIDFQEDFDFCEYLYKKNPKKYL